MNLRSFVAPFALALSLTVGVGCAAPQSDGDLVVDSESEVTSFEVTPLWQITENDLADAYAHLLAADLATAKQKNPDVTRVSAAGVVAFAGGWGTLKGSLEWYFETTGAKTIAVSSIVRTLMGKVRPAIRGSVQADGFVKGSLLDGKVPAELVWAVDEARFNASVRAIENPEGVDLKEVFARVRGEYGAEGLHLPVRMSKKPTTKQLSDQYEIDFAGALTGQKAKEMIGEIFDTVVLEGVLEAKSIKSVWYTSESYGDSEKHFAFFMDDKKQVWGVSLTFQVD